MRLTLVKSGGLAGLVRKPLVVDTHLLPADSATWLEGLVAKAHLEEPLPYLAPKATPDAFGYELMVESAKGTQRVSFEYAEATEPLQKLVAGIRKLAASPSNT